MVVSCCSTAVAVSQVCSWTATAGLLSVLSSASAVTMGVDSFGVVESL
jgi:hypothetical protein